MQKLRMVAVYNSEKGVFMVGQMTIFDFLSSVPVKPVKFEAVEEFCKIVHIENRHQRIKTFFENNEDIKERVKFLKKEYGMGGGSGMNKDAAYKICSYESDGRGHRVCWNAMIKGELHKVETTFGYETLAKTIASMMERGVYGRKEK